MPEMIAGARNYITVPAVPALGGGVLSVARVIDGDPHSLMGAQYLTDACGDNIEAWTEWCSNDPVAAKLFDSSQEVVEGDPFALYSGVACDFQRVDDAKARASAHFGYGEGRMFDVHFAAMLEDGAGTVDLGGPYPITAGLGLAEAYAAAVYGGVPTILVPRLVAPCACSCGGIISFGGSLSTCSGSPVGAITTSVANPPGPDELEATLYVTGQITVLRGPIATFSVPQQPLADGAYAPARALAERIYVPLYECFAAKVAVTCS